MPQRIPQDSVRCICMHVPKLFVPSQMFYGVSKDPAGFCKVHVHAHMSKLSIPSQMCYHASRDPTEIRKVHMQARVQAICPIPNVLYMVPQRIPQDSIRCICMHVSKLSVSSQMCYDASKDPIEFPKVHVHAHVQAVRPIPNVLQCLKGSYRIL